MYTPVNLSFTIYDFMMVYVRSSKKTNSASNLVHTR